INWDVDELAIDRHSGRVAFTVNEDGASTLYLLDGDERVQVELPLGIISSLDFSPIDGKQLGFTLSRPDAPSDAYSFAVAGKLAENARPQLVRWTYSEVGGLNSERFITPERIRFESFDGRKIPAYVFRPR